MNLKIVSLLLLSSSLSLSSALYANDGGFTMVDVKKLGITHNTSDRSAVATFEGSDASELVKVLPDDPVYKDTKGAKGNIKRLLISTTVADKDNTFKTIALACANGEIDSDKYKAYKDGAKCKFEIVSEPHFSGMAEGAEGIASLDSTYINVRQKHDNKTEVVFQGPGLKQLMKFLPKSFTIPLFDDYEKNFKELRIGGEVIKNDKGDMSQNVIDIKCSNGRAVNDDSNVSTGFKYVPYKVAPKCRISFESDADFYDDIDTIKFNADEVLKAAAEDAPKKKKGKK